VSGEGILSALNMVKLFGGRGSPQTPLGELTVLPQWLPPSQELYSLLSGLEPRPFRPQFMPLFPQFEILDLRLPTT